LAVLISCEKCATTYVLDDGMIPPQGAPVQCTRCGFVFTAKPVAQVAPSSNQTQAFGVSAVPAPENKNQTMVFGAGSVPALKNETVAFGRPAVQPPAAAAPAMNQTLVFGAKAVQSSKAEVPAPAQRGAPPSNQTLVFGARGVTPKGDVSIPAVGTAGLNLSASDQTVRVDVSSLKFSSETPVPQRAPESPRSSTVLFGRNDAQATLDPDAVEGEAESQPSAEKAFAAHFPKAREEPTERELSALSPADENVASLELPPDPAFSSRGFPPSHGDASDNDDLGEIAAMKRGTKIPRLLVVVLLLLLLAAALALAWKLVGEKFFAAGVSFETKQQLEASLALLRLDDTDSKKEAIVQLTALQKSQPQLVEGAAALALARALVFDDLQQRVARVKQQQERLKARIEVAESPATGAADGLNEALSALREKHAALAPELATARKELEVSLALLQEAAARPGGANTPSAQQWALKSTAVAKGVLADVEALSLSARFRSNTKGAPGDIWLEMAEPEYYANAQSSKESRDGARAQLERLRLDKANSTLLRSYVLEARLALKDGSLAEAEEALSQVVTMRANHDVAQELLAWVQSEQQSSKD
jgi:predicted Zn finger-like uncharacterized protein